MMTRRQLTLTLMTILLIGLFGAGVSRFDARHSLVPAVKAQSTDEPLERNSIFDRVRTRVCTNGFAEGRYGYTFNGTVITPAGVATTQPSES
jgi:hypothetical protein